MEARILRLNLAGQPIEWLNWRQGVCLYARDLVSWTLGGVVRQVRGGKSRVTGKASVIRLPAIMACGGERLTPIRLIPPLNNLALFQRDNFQCLYCGNLFTSEELSRDHVQPTSQVGECGCGLQTLQSAKRKSFALRDQYVAIGSTISPQPI
jgi:5-methylcytosine-specific restriction endonuclease McrA